MKAGDIVVIYNTSPSGMPRIEGKAKLIRHYDDIVLSDGFEQWQVEFIDEPGETYQRTVDVNEQLSK